MVEIHYWGVKRRLKSPQTAIYALCVFLVGLMLSQPHSPLWLICRPVLRIYKHSGTGVPEGALTLQLALPSTVWMGQLWAACATSESGGNMAVLSSSETARFWLHLPFPLLKYTTPMWSVTPRPHDASPPDPNASHMKSSDVAPFLCECWLLSTHPIKCFPVSTSHTESEPWSPGSSLLLSIIRNMDKTTTSDKLDLTLCCWWIIRVHLPVLITVMAHSGWYVHPAAAFSAVLIENRQRRGLQPLAGTPGRET